MGKPNKALTKLLLKNRPEKCENCGGKLFYQGMGQYLCKSCGNIMLDDYGKVRQFLEENGPMPYVVISEATGVDMDILTLLVREGKVEFLETSDYFLKCERCGCSLRYGRFCQDCYRELTQGLKAAFSSGTMGEKPRGEGNTRSHLNSDRSGKMRFIKNNR